jgi:hypothetical protein
MKRISERMAARFTGSRGVKAHAPARPLEIFDDDRGIDHDVAVVIERRHHAVGIDREILGLELIAAEQSRACRSTKAGPWH